MSEDNRTSDESTTSTLASEMSANWCKRSADDDICQRFNCKECPRGNKACRLTSHNLYTNASGSWGCSAYSLPVLLQFSTHCTLSHLRSSTRSYLQAQSGSTNGLGRIFSATLTMLKQCAMSTASMLTIHSHPTYCVGWHYLWQS